MDLSENETDVSTESVISEESDGRSTKTHLSSPIRRYIGSQHEKRKYEEDSQKFEDLKRNLNLGRAKRVRVPPNPDPAHGTNNGTRKTWAIECIPESKAELCIHKRKIDDLEKNISDLIYQRSKTRMLVVSGPSGSGKSTAVKLLAGEIMSRKLSLYRQNMLGSEISDNLNKSTGSSEDHIVEFNILSESSAGKSSVSYFSEFLSQCKLLTGLNEKCIIVEELPNIFHKDTHSNFQGAIWDWISSNDIRLPPLIMCLTEFDIDNDLDYNNGTTFTIENTVKVETVLGHKLMLLENNGWKRIKFNRVAKTFLRKALERACKVEEVQRNRHIDEQIDTLSNLGDLRNAINSLEFWYNYQYDPNEEVEYSSLGKGVGMNLFHSIGKILYNTKHKSEEVEEFRKRHNITDYHRIDPHLAVADNVSSEVMSHLIRFNLCCLENYACITSNVSQELNEFMEILSVSDNLIQRSSSSSQSSILNNASFFSCYGMRHQCELMIRGNDNSRMSLQAGNACKGLVYSRDSKLKKRQRSTMLEVAEHLTRRELRMIRRRTFANICALDFILIDGYYQPFIFSSFKFRYMMYQRGKMLDRPVERIGGRFTNTLTADDEIIAEEDDHNAASKVAITLLEDVYFGSEEHMSSSEHDDDGGEFASDPIEDSSDEVFIENTGEEEEDADVFSDNSEVMRLFEE